MKIQINRKLLADALSDLTPVIGRNKALPILQCVKFVTKGNRIRLQASDVENTIRKYVLADSIDLDGEFLVNGKAFADLLKSLHDDLITIEVGDSQLTLTHAKGTARLAVQDAKEYPDNTKVEDSIKFNLPAKAIIKAIEESKSFVCTDDLRPHMKHVYASVKGGVFSYAATDTRKLIANEIAVNTGDLECEWYFSTAATSMILKACSTVEEVEIEVNSSWASYRTGDTIIYTQLPKGKFPPYQRIIPKNNTIKCVVNKGELVDSIKRCLMFSNEATQLMKITLTFDEIGLSADFYEKGRQLDETITAECDSTLAIGFNASMLLDCLSVYRGEKAILTFSDSAHPMLLVEESEPKKCILLMPMVINNYPAK
jgi:DNA polymerase-3 subunit beta